MILIGYLSIKVYLGIKVYLFTCNKRQLPHGDFPLFTKLFTEPQNLKKLHFSLVVPNTRDEPEQIVRNERQVLPAYLSWESRYTLTCSVHCLTTRRGYQMGNGRGLTEDWLPQTLNTHHTTTPRTGINREQVPTKDPLLLRHCHLRVTTQHYSTVQYSGQLWSRSPPVTSHHLYSRTAT